MQLRGEVRTPIAASTAAAAEIARGTGAAVPLLPVPLLPVPLPPRSIEASIADAPAGRGAAVGATPEE